MGQVGCSPARADRYAEVPAEERNTPPTVHKSSSMNMALYCNKIREPMKWWEKQLVLCSQPISTQPTTSPTTASSSSFGIKTQCPCSELLTNCLIEYGSKSIKIKKNSSSEIALKVLGSGNTLRIEIRHADGRECCIICEPRYCSKVIFTWPAATFDMGGFNRPHLLEQTDAILHSITILYQL